MLISYLLLTVGFRRGRLNLILCILSMTSEPTEVPVRWGNGSVGAKNTPVKDTVNRGTSWCVFLNSFHMVPAGFTN